MITKNLKKIFNCAISSTTVNVTLLDTNNAEYTQSNSQTRSVLASTVQSVQGMQVKLGDGETSPTEDDLSLENDITSSLNLVASTNVNTTEGTAMYARLISCQYYNAGSTPITVKEVGLYYSNTTSNVKHDVLCTRKVLDTPVIIPSGETYSFTVQLKFE